MANGEEALEDQSTDYSQPRKRKMPSKFVDIDDDDGPSCSFKKKKKPNNLESDSDSPDSEGDIPGSKIDMVSLQAKVEKALALKQVKIPQITEKCKTKTKNVKIVKVPQKSSGKDCTIQKGKTFTVQNIISLSFWIHY